MLIDFRCPGSWAALSELAAAALKIDLSKNALRFYENSSHALIEITQGLAKQFPLKKKIFYFKNMSVAFEPALSLLAKEGYQLTALDIGQLANVESFKAGLDRETLCMLFSVDDPILGLHFSTEQLEVALVTASIARIKLSHSRHVYAKTSGFGFSPEIDRNEVRVFTLPSGRALAHMGERLRVGALVASEIDWSTKDIRTDIKSDLVALVNPLEGNLQDAISKFESSGQTFGAEKFSYELPASVAKRFYDRAILIWQDMDGHAVIDRLAKSLKLKLESPGFEYHMETLSLSRWGGVRTFDFLQSYGLSLNQRRGLVIFGSSLFERFGAFEIEKTLLEVRRSLLREQNGTQ